MTSGNGKSIGKTGQATRKRLRDVLDRYGADPRRWPDDEREGLRALAKSDSVMARELDDTLAFDRLLDLAPAGAPSGALKDRIVAAAHEDKRPAKLAVSDRPRRERSARAANPVQTITPRRQPIWPAAALMAASLAIGIYLGASGVTTPYWPGTQIAAAEDDAFEDAADLLGNGSTEDLL